MSVETLQVRGVEQQHFDAARQQAALREALAVKQAELEKTQRQRTENRPVQSGEIRQTGSVQLIGPDGVRQEVPVRGQRVEVSRGTKPVELQRGVPVIVRPIEAGTEAEPQIVQAA
jgi:hypothetical protein